MRTGAESGGSSGEDDGGRAAAPGERKELPMLPEAVRAYLQANRSRHLAELMELLRFDSIANLHDQADSCRRCAEALAGRLRDLGLEAELMSMATRPNVVASAHVGDDRPTLLMYAHYDVQPPEPIELWESDPFEPVVRDDYIYGRGASDDKGQLFAQLMAVEAWQRAGGGLPVNLKLFIEGEEEVGSPNLESFIAGHCDLLASDAAVISDSEFFAAGTPAITYSLRGLVYAEVTVRGPTRQVHSGLHGGALANPINGLARLLSGMHDRDGRVTIEGFYDDVVELTEAERRDWARLPFDPAEYAASLGVGMLGGGEKSLGVLERRWARPTLDCNGIIGGHVGPGAKTVIPAGATAKVSMRLVPNQDPERIAAGFREFVAGNTPAGLSSSVSIGVTARPVLVARDSPAMGAASAALEEAFGRSPTFIRCGASVPVAELIQRLLGIDAVLMGFGLPDDGLHGPNERFCLEQLWQGSLASAAFMHNLARAGRTGQMPNSD